MKKSSLLRKIYLYSFSLLGLVLLVIAGIRFLDMGLKAFVFTQAEEQQKVDYMRPTTIYSIEKLQSLESVEQGLSEDEKIQIRQMIQSYQEWQEQKEKVDPIIANRHRNASSSLAMILIGLPLYLYHWLTIKKEEKLVVDK